MRKKAVLFVCFLVLIPLVIYYISTRHSVSASLNFVTKWGFEEGYSGGKVNGKFFYPNAVAIDQSGNVYVADTENDRIQEFDSSGTYIRKWGTSGSGNGQFSAPEGVAVATASGNIYVIDTNNDRVEEFDSSGGYIAQWGSYGSGNNYFMQPEGIAVDSTGNVYVADTDSGIVKKYDSSGNYLLSFGGFNYPEGLAVDSSDNVYVADSGNDQVQEYDSTGAYVAQWSTSPNSPASVTVDPSGDVYISLSNDDMVDEFSSSGSSILQWGGYGSQTGQFSQPEGLGIDSSGDIFVADSLNNRVEKFDSSGNYLSELGYFLPSDGAFDNPEGIAADSSGNVYVADTQNDRIQKFDNSGNYLGQWGTPGTGSGQLSSPYTLAIGPPSSPEVYVIDSGNNRVEEFDTGGTFIRSWGSEGTGNSEFVDPEGIAVDPSGNVYVDDTGNDRVEKFDSSGNYLTQWGSSGGADGQFSMPIGIAIDSTGNVYVADSGNNRVQRFNTSGAYIGQWGGSAGSSLGSFETITGIAVDPTGNVYVADTDNYRIQEFSSSGAFIAYGGGFGTGNGQFEIPEGVAFDPAGDLFVVDEEASTVQKFTVTLDLGPYFSNADQSFYRGDNTVNSLLEVGNTLYLGGAFGLEAVDLTTGGQISWTPGLPNGAGGTPEVYSLAYSASNNILYVGSSIGLLEYDTSSGTGTLDTDFGSVFAQSDGGNPTVYALAIANDTLYAGGSFTSIDTNPRVNLAAFDISTQTAVLRSWEQDTDDAGTVYALATSSGDLYVGGVFSTINGSPQPAVAAFDLGSGSLVGSFVSGFLAGDTVFSLAYDNNSLYAGGEFSSVNGSPFENLVSLDTATGGANLAWVPNTEYPVYALAIEGNYIYAGENNSGEGGFAQGYNLMNGDSIDWYPQDTQPVMAMLATDPALYVGLSADQYFGSAGLRKTFAVKDNPSFSGIIPVAQAADLSDQDSGLLADIGGLSGTIYLAEFDALTSVTPTSSAPSSSPSPTPTPTSAPSQGSGGGGGGGGGSSPPVCSDQKPGTPSNIQLQAGPGAGQVTLTWTPPTGPVTDYSITYSDEPNTKLWGVVSTGNVTSYTISNLPLNQNYYFWVNAVNGCMPGDAIDPEIHLGSTPSSSYTVSTGNPAPGTSGTSVTLPPPSPLPPTGPADIIKIGTIGVIFTIMGASLLLAL